MRCLVSAACPNSTDRLFSVGYYLGLGPLLRLLQPDSSGLFLQHHFTQAMAAFSSRSVRCWGPAFWKARSAFSQLDFPVWSNYWWTRSENLEIHGRLQLVYVFACNGGKRATQ